MREKVYDKAFEFTNIQKEVFEKAMAFETRQSNKSKFNNKLKNDEVNDVILEIMQLELIDDKDKVMQAMKLKISLEIKVH